MPLAGQAVGPGMRVVGVLEWAVGVALGLQLIAAARTKKKASAGSEMAMRFTCVIMKRHK